MLAYYFTSPIGGLPQNHCVVRFIGLLVMQKLIFFTPQQRQSG